MKSQFRHVALIGKYQAQGSRSALESIAHFLSEQGCDVAIEQDTASNTGMTQYPILDVAGIGAHCDLGLVVGGDGTMLGIGRVLAQFGVPLSASIRGVWDLSPTLHLTTTRQCLGQCSGVNTRKIAAG